MVDIPVVLSSCPTADPPKSKNVLKLMIKPNAAKGSAVSNCMLVKSSFLVCGADRVVWMCEDARSVQERDVTKICT